MKANLIALNYKIWNKDKMKMVSVSYVKNITLEKYTDIIYDVATFYVWTFSF